MMFSISKLFSSNSPFFDNEVSSSPRRARKAPTERGGIMPTATQVQIVNPEAQYFARVRPVEVCSQSDWFDWQIEKLVGKKRCTYGDADPFRNRIKEFGPDNFVFVPAPPPKTLDFAELMADVELDGSAGASYVDLRYHENLDKVIRTASVLVDVDDGWERLNVKPSVSRANILAEGRHTFCTWRGIIYAILFPWCLRGHGQHLVGSQFSAFKGSVGVPGLCVGISRPGLFANWDDPAYLRWGAPSCGSVLVP